MWRIRAVFVERVEDGVGEIWRKLFKIYKQEYLVCSAGSLRFGQVEEENRCKFNSLDKVSIEKRSKNFIQSGISSAILITD